MCSNICAGLHFTNTASQLRGSKAMTGSFSLKDDGLQENAEKPGLIKAIEMLM